MIKKRIISALLYRNNTLAVSKQFKQYRVVGYPVQTMKIYNLRNVDEVLFNDISENIDKPNYKLIEEILRYAFMPITIGGGIRKLEDIKNLLYAGADKICLSTAAFYNFKFVKDAIQQFGGQAITIAVDYLYEKNKTYLIFNPGYNKVEVDIISYLKKISDAGVSEIVLTSVEHNGMMNGYDIDYAKKINNITNCGIIINGGANTYKDLLNVFSETNAVAAGVSSMFFFTEQTQKTAKQFLHKKEINVRI